MANLRNGVDDYLIIKPTTFMNLSGEAVRAVMDYYKIQNVLADTEMKKDIGDGISTFAKSKKVSEKLND